MKRIPVILCLLVSLSFFSSFAKATIITDLFNTGVQGYDEEGNIIYAAYNTPDPHYTLIQSPSTLYTDAIVIGADTAWTTPNPESESRWIGVTESSYAYSGIYQYQTSFNISSDADLSSVQIDGYWYADDSGGNWDTRIMLNGTDTGINNLAPFNSPNPGTPFSISYGDNGSQFLIGTNFLVFQVENKSGIGRNQTGLRVSNIQGSFDATPVPEPAATFLIGIGAAGLAAVGRRRKKA